MMDRLFVFVERDAGKFHPQLISRWKSWIFYRDFWVNNKYMSITKSFTFDSICIYTFSRFSFVKRFLFRKLSVFDFHYAEDFGGIFFESTNKFNYAEKCFCLGDFGGILIIGRKFFCWLLLKVASIQYSL